MVQLQNLFKQMKKETGPIRQIIIHRTHYLYSLKSLHGNQRNLRNRYISYMLVDRASRQLTKVSAQCIISKSNVKTVFRATECLSLFSLKQCTLKKKFRLVFCDIWSNQGRGT